MKEIKALLESTKGVAANNERDYCGHTDNELLEAVRRAECAVQIVGTLLHIRKYRDEADLARQAEARAKNQEITMDDLLREQREKFAGS